MTRQGGGLGLQSRVAGERPDMPIIVVTSCADISMSVEAMKAGAIEFLAKPLRDDVMVATIRHSLERSRRILEREARTKIVRDSY